MFTTKEIEYAKKVIGEFAKCKNHGRNFSGIDFTLDSSAGVDDTLMIGDFAIVKVPTTITVASILGDRSYPGFVYIPHFPTVIPGNFYEPDLPDMKELGECKTLADALSEIYLECVREGLENIHYGCTYEVYEREGAEET